MSNNQAGQNESTKPNPFQDLTKDLFRSEDSRFQILTAAKFVSVVSLTIVFSVYMIWIFMTTTHIYFEANGLMASEVIKEAFFDHVMEDLSVYIPFIFVFLITVFFLGIYMGSLSIRPFRMLAQYSNKQRETGQGEYNPDLIPDFKLLTHFSIKFFTYIKTSKEAGEFKPQEVGEPYNNIDRPVFDKNFCFHYGFILTFILLGSLFFQYILNIEIHESIVTMGLESLSTPNKGLTHFLSSQGTILTSIIVINSFLLIVGYVWIGTTLMRRVNGVAFNYFRTMKDIMGGNKNVRVRLRTGDPSSKHAEDFNRYLDHIL